MPGKWRLALTAAMMWVVLGTACTAQLRDVNEQMVTRYDGRSLSLDDMERVIRLAAYREDWQKLDLVAPGHFVATRHDPQGKWSATVDILYGPGSYSIHYKDSQGLRYHPELHNIAHEYKSIVEDLSDRIRGTAEDIDFGRQP